jgi:hypothetical protein
MVDRFDIAYAKRDQVITNLLRLPDAQGDDDGGPSAEISFIREGNAKGLLPTTLVGRAVVDGSVLWLETNSIARADRLRGLVEEHLGAAVVFRVREHSDPTARLREGGGRRAARAVHDEPMPPEVLEVVKKKQRALPALARRGEPRTCRAHAPGGCQGQGRAARRPHAPARRDRTRPGRSARPAALRRGPSHGGSSQLSDDGSHLPVTSTKSARRNPCHLALKSP